MWVLLRLPRFGGANYASGHDNRSRYCEVGISDAGHRRGEPTLPETVYVPYYEPSVVYGTWDYADYPSYYFEPAPGYVLGGAIATGIACAPSPSAMPSGIVVIGGPAKLISISIRTIISTGTSTETT